ncbi:MAG TPA: glutaredoxin domain-containing protein [Beutenbergiaceae bacterium]|nr:glutaredoxin domain-containing protein [Beutenbergiaceae bacterium]
MRWLWVPLLGGTLYLVIDTVAEDRVWVAAGYAVVGLALTWWLSPWQGGVRRIRHEEVMSRPPAERPVVVYWRPGCAYCARLRGRLGRAGQRAVWVNIWRDKNAAAYVQSVNHGDETVPTVVLDGRPLTNPDPALVRDRLTGR